MAQKNGPLGDNHHKCQSAYVDQPGARTGKAEMRADAMKPTGFIQWWLQGDLELTLDVTDHIVRPGKSVKIDFTEAGSGYTAILLRTTGPYYNGQWWFRDGLNKVGGPVHGKLTEGRYQWTFEGFWREDNYDYDFEATLTKPKRGHEQTH